VFLNLCTETSEGSLKPHTRAILYLSLVVPAFNEETRLPSCLLETIKYLKNRVLEDPKNFGYEVIVVDDGSNDKTSRVAREISRNEPSDTIKVITLKKNYGKGFAVKVGVFASRGKYILMLDADGATNIEDLRVLEEQMSVSSEDYSGQSDQITSTTTSKLVQRKKTLQDGTSDGGKIVPCEVVFGSRKHLSAEAVVKRSLCRNILMYGFHFVVRFLITSEIKDTQCGFKLFTRDAARSIFGSLHISRWAFDIEVVFLSQLFKLTIREIPVTWHEVSGSKLNIITASIEMLRDMIAIRCLYALGIWTPCACSDQSIDCGAELSASPPSSSLESWVIA